MTLTKLIKIILPALLLLLSASGMAQSVDSLRQVALNPVVITGTGTYHKANNSPVAVKVITAKEMRDAGVTTLQDALARLTTTITTHTSGMGTFVNFGGVSDDYIVILENGRRVSGDDRWARLSLSNIRRIEVFNGAASALYGSDAIAGVINIITDDSSDPVAATISTKVMNHGRLDHDIHADVTEGRFSSHTTYARRQADGWQVNPYQAFSEGDKEVLKLTGRPMSAAFGSDALSERLEWRFSDTWSAYLRGDAYDYETRRPQGATYFTQKSSKDPATGEKVYTYTPRAAYTYDLHHQTFTYGGGVRWAPDNRTHVYLDLHTDLFRSDYDYWQTAEAEAYAETRKRTRHTDGTLRGIFRLTDAHKLTAGTQYVGESLVSESDNILGEQTHTYNLFAQDEVRIFRGLEAVVGVRYTYNTHFGSAFTPNVALFGSVGDFRLRASYAGGYRTPTLSQLYATDQAKTTSRYTLPNTSLQPERSSFWNVNAEYSNQTLAVSLSGFINNIRDMINYRTLTAAEVQADASLRQLVDEGWTTLRRRDNIDRAKLRGFSANLKWMLPAGITLGGGYTFTDSKAETITLDAAMQAYVTTVTPVDKSVRHVGNVMASWDKTWGDYHLCVSLDGHIQGQRYSSTYGYAPAYSQWDFHTRHIITLAHCTLEPGLGIENILNCRDTSYWNSNFSTINPGRSIYASLALRY
jgi:outer membrane receptor for ferrienterochelin and colicins